MKKFNQQKTAKLLEYAGKGDKEAISELRKQFDAQPALREQVGNIAFQAEHSLVNLASGGNTVVKEATYEKLQAMKEDLAGSAPTPLEKLLVERVVVCWFQVYYIDTIYAQNMKTISPKQADYYQQHQDRAHRRYLSAIRTLAQVRRLLIPTVQVNIGNQQVNAAQLTAFQESKRPIEKKS